jgi:predicted RNA-binding protein YlqC (UPF0109 family)
MSAFDDEFGLFGEEAESERRSALPARRISTERGNDGVESESAPRAERRPRGGRRRDERERPQTKRDSQDPWASTRHASELLSYLVKRLVSKPDDVNVELFMDESGEPVIELVVDPEDLGKVIGRNGRVAHALRTLVRATAESRVAVDIIDSAEAAQPLATDA